MHFLPGYLLMKAVWISPVVKNTPGGYHGYWASNLDEINQYFGSSADLLAVSAALHARGMCTSRACMRYMRYMTAAA